MAEISQLRPRLQGSGFWTGDPERAVLLYGHIQSPHLTPFGLRNPRELQYTGHAILATDGRHEGYH